MFANRFSNCSNQDETTRNKKSTIVRQIR